MKEPNAAIAQAAAQAIVAEEPRPHSQRGHLWELSRTKLVEHVERAWRFVWEAKEKQALWHGKWLMVKSENNKLRAANRALRTEVADLKIEVGYAKVECQSRCAYQQPDCHCPACSPRKIDKGGSGGLFTDTCETSRIDEIIDEAAKGQPFMGDE